jgi:hypothetical protein
MKFQMPSADDLRKLHHAQPEVLTKHAHDLTKHEGPGLLKVAVSKAAGWGAGLASEALLATAFAASAAIPVVGPAIAAAGEVAAPFAAIKIGEWAEKRTLAWLTKEKTEESAPVRRDLAQSPGFTPQLAYGTA